MQRHIVGVTENLITFEKDSAFLVQQSGWEASWDKLVWEAVFGGESKAFARWIIWEVAQNSDLMPSSIHDYYIAKGRGDVQEVFTVPAINVRGMAHDTARAAFSAAVRLKVGALLL